MPIYEYSCLACQRRFEVLVLNNSVPQCPTCGHGDLRRELSLFAVSSEQTRQSSVKSARSANLKIEKDKETANEEYVRTHHEP